MRNIQGERLDYSSEWIGFHMACDRETRVVTISNLHYKRVSLAQFAAMAQDVYDYASNIKGLDAQLFTTQFGRCKKYTGATWDTVCGQTTGKTFTDALVKFPYFPLVEEVILPNGDALDAPHFWAVLNGLIKGHGDLCGWAGDLVTFAKDVKDGNARRFPSASFGYADWVSDADAVDLYKKHSNDIISNLETYFTKKLTNSERIKNFYDNILVKSNTYNAFIASKDYTEKLPIINKSYLESLMLVNDVTLKDIENASLLLDKYFVSNSKITIIKIDELTSEIPSKELK